MPLFDTHAHYNDDAFDQDRKGLLDALPDAGVGAVVIPGVDVESSRSALALAESRPWLFAAAGIHPEDCAGCTAADFSAIRDLCREKKVVAIGEIGLDYYWAENPPKEFQQMVFRRQLELALELELPVIVHDREAHGDSLEIVKEFPGVRGVFHCFSGSPEMAEELLKRGWYLGFDGPVTYKNARRAPEVVAVTPLDRIVVETDAPYMSPVPNRGRRNDSRNLPYIVEKLAEWKGHLPGGDGGAHLEQWPAAVRAGGEGMKKAFLMVLACLLLAGCGAPTGTTAKVPETAPEEPISAPAVVTEGRVRRNMTRCPRKSSLCTTATSGEPLALLAGDPRAGDGPLRRGGQGRAPCVVPLGRYSGGVSGLGNLHAKIRDAGAAGPGPGRRRGRGAGGLLLSGREPGQPLCPTRIAAVPRHIDRFPASRLPV